MINWRTDEPGSIRYLLVVLDMNCFDNFSSPRPALCVREAFCDENRRWEVEGKLVSARYIKAWAEMPSVPLEFE